MKDKIFGVLQRVGRSFMLPIALLPIAGLLLGIGSSLTNPVMLQTYGLDGAIHESTVPYAIFNLMAQCGSAVFSNLPLLFAMGVAIGMAKKEKAVAALSGAISYLVMNVSIYSMIEAHGGVDSMAPNTTTTVLGITTLQMGVFGGIIVGLGVAALHNRFYKIQLPQVLSFFGGTRFVPIISTAVYLLVGVGMFYLWPFVQAGITALGGLVLKSGYAGTWVYGVIERALIPFGLHHVFYMPFWQTAMGGEMVVNGVTVQGAQNIFFAELASDNVTHFSVSATRFMSGKFPFMIFGLPGAALAMYRTARPEKRKLVGSLLLSAALTSMITGITEPLEFTFLFLAPGMYAVHCVYAGLSYMLMHILNVGVGMTFSGGLIDLVLFGVLQGNEKTSWIWVPVIGVGYFFLYFFTFYLMIRKFNIQTPGREPDNVEPKLFTRSDFNKKKSGGAAGGFSDPVSALILQGLGGKDNLSDVDCCATRLRVTVIDAAKVNDAKLKQSGASGVIHKGNGVQVIYGPQVSVIKSNLEDFMDTPEAARVMEAEVAEAPAEEKAASAPAEKQKDATLYAHMNGTVVPMEDVEDEAFAECILGEGVAVEPDEGKLYCPADGTVDNVFDTRHAIGIITDDGAELLLHIGINTVQLNGKHFTVHVEQDQPVKKGDLLISFDMDAIKAEGCLLTTPMIVCNTDDYSEVKPLLSGGKISAGTALLEVKG